MRLIDADAIRKIMYRKAFEEDSDLQRWDSGCWIRYKMFVQALVETPTIEAEPVRRGKWLADNNNPYESAYVCSCCKLSEAVPTSMYKPLWEYCPNCGAKMEV